MAGAVWRLDEGDTTGWQRWDEGFEEWLDDTPAGVLFYVPPVAEDEVDTGTRSAEAISR